MIQGKVSDTKKALLASVLPGTTSEISIQKSAVLGSAKILRRALRLPGVW